MSTTNQRPKAVIPYLIGLILAMSCVAAAQTIQISDDQFLDAGGATVGYWRFEEGVANTPATGSNTVLDSSDNELHGTPVKEPVYRAEIPGSGLLSNTRSLEFDGITGQRVTVPDGPLVTLTQSLTIEAFIKAKPLKPGTGGMGIIVFRADNRPGLDPYVLAMGTPGNILTFQVQNANQQVAELKATVPYDQWLHVAGTLDDATGAMKLYVNWSEVASTTTAIRPLFPEQAYTGNLFPFCG